MHKFCLPTAANGCYVFSAPEKSGVGFDSLNANADNRTYSVMRLFYVRSKPSYAQIMAGRDGGASALAGFISASLSTLSRPATLFDSGEQATQLANEAITMVNANPCTHPKFIWRFFSCQNSTYHTVTATSESEARNLLPDSHCMFAARLPVQGDGDITTPSTTEKTSTVQEVRHA